MSTKQKILLITGGSNGIGLASIKRFKAANYYIINFDIMPSDIADVDIQVDLSSPDAIQDAFDKLKTQFHTIDALISNAGIHYSGTVESTSIDDYYKVINTNLSSCFFVLKHAVSLMKAHGGRIVTIGSDQSFIGKGNSAAYGLTKAAIAQLTKNIAIDYAQYNISANCVCPGTIDTPLYQKAVKNYCERSGRNEGEVHQEEKETQLNTRIGTPEEVASLIFYLIHEAGDFILGSNILIDGGYCAK